MAAMRVNDRVRIRVMPETERAGIAGNVGTVRGTSALSEVTADVFGQDATGEAVRVFIPEVGHDCWLVPDLLEPVRHGADKEHRVRPDAAESTARTDGNWRQGPAQPRKLNWFLRFFKALRKYR